MGVRMTEIYLVVDHWSNEEEELYALGWRRFFVTKLLALQAVKRLQDVDVIVDNGTYHRGRPDFSLVLLAARLGYKYIMPDIIGDPKKTLELHLLFADRIDKEVGRQALENGFAVMQCDKISLDYCMKVFDTLRSHGLVRRNIAVAFPKEFRNKSLIQRLLASLYQRLKSYGVWIHSLGFATQYADSYDTSSWGYRLLDQHLVGDEYDLRKVVDLFRRKHNTTSKR